MIRSRALQGLTIGGIVGSIVAAAIWAAITGHPPFEHGDQRSGPADVPVRGTWDSPAGGSASPAPSAAWLDELAPVDGKPDYVGLFSVKGRSIAHGVGFQTYSGSPHQASYDLGGHYATFTVDLAIGDKDSKDSAYFDI